MSLVKHPNILPVYASFVVGNKLWIVTPCVSPGSYLDVLKLLYPQGLKQGIIAAFLIQTLLGLEYLHKNNLIHRDVKPGNL